MMKNGARGFCYPGIGAVFWVASSQHTQGLLQLFIGEAHVLFLVVLSTCCHSGGGKKERAGEAGRQLDTEQFNTVDKWSFKAGVCTDTT